MTRLRRTAGIAMALIFLLLSGGPADAAKKKKKGTADAAADVKVKEGGGKQKKPKVYDFGAIGIEGSMRTPQLLYFLGRAREELERASLEKRSFMPELARSVDEGSL